jgi:cytochrome c556
MRLLIVLFLAGAAIAQAPAFRPKPIGNLKQVMRGILLPNSDAIFGVAQTAPKNDKEWADVENSAIAIAEAAALIAMPGRLRENGQAVPVQRPDWIKYTQELAESARASYKAAQSKSQDAVSMSTDRLSEACDSCHMVYRDKR